MSNAKGEVYYSRVNGTVKVPVKVDSECWEAEWKRKYKIDFSLFALPREIVEAAKSYLKARLSVTGPQCIATVKQLLSFLDFNWDCSWSDFSHVKLVQLMNLWNLPSINQSRAVRLELKRFYGYCCEHSVAGADVFVGAEIESWNASIDAFHYKNLLIWHEERGAMTASEQELLRRCLQSSGENESVSEHYLRIFLLACFETIKRPSQILEMKSDALVEIKVTETDSQYFLRIPKAKKQLGRKPELWPITSSLAYEIINYTSIAKVSKAQLKFGFLLVGDGSHNRCPIYNVSSSISRWVRKRNIISPRTNKLLVVTPYRLRHSGATALAMQGVSSTEIQYILEHDSVHASQAYIDAIGSELAPLLSKVDRKVGYIFSKPNESFFKGSVQQHLLAKKILIPVIEAPAVVGSCGVNGKCNKHPFLQCYNGCKYFVAWADADHTKALEYVQSELARWEKSEGLNERSKSIRDFERVRVAISDVIRMVEEQNAGCD